MSTAPEFQQAIGAAYQFKEASIRLGSGMLDGKVVDNTAISIPCRTLNRHGLIAGATGTGKTKTLQLMAEAMSEQGIPVVLMDIKGDLSGLAARGESNARITERADLLQYKFEPTAFPVEFFTISDEKGVRLRATVSEFGPILLSRILGLNDTQGGLVAVLFKYADDHRLPLLNLPDFIRLIQWAGAEGKKDIEKEYGKLSTTSLGTILRKLVELQQQGADRFFGEKSFEVEDFMQLDQQGRGMISIFRVTDMQDRPKLFSTFMLQLLAELYARIPEAGDLEKPRLILFIDEAHLLFREASPALMQQLETVVKLIRSKGIGIFFCTQDPRDVPAAVLSQLGLKIQHSLRAFTAADRKSIRQTAENYPESSFYETEELITAMGIGEALVTALDEKGRPTPLAHTMLVPPRSRMGVLSDAEIGEIISRSQLAIKYNQEIDSHSAYEILSKKMEMAAEEEEEPRKTSKKEKDIFDHPTVRQIGRTAASVLTRSLLGALGIGRRRRR